MSNLEEMPDYDPLTKFGVVWPDFGLEVPFRDRLTRLHARNRSIWMLRYQNVSFQKIANIFGLRKSTVKQYHSEANRFLKEEFPPISRKRAQSGMGKMPYLPLSKRKAVRKKKKVQKERWGNFGGRLEPIRFTIPAGKNAIQCDESQAVRIVNRLRNTGFVWIQTGKWMRNYGRVRCVEFFVLPHHPGDSQRRFRVTATLL